jgi:hypothetical protein
MAEEYRRADGKISTEGFSKPLGDGERRAIEQQHRNRDVSRGSHAEVEARQAARAVGGMKAPARSTGVANGTAQDNRRRGG